MKKLKIAHFTQFLVIGGLEKVILELALQQKSQGHNVTIIVYDSEQTWLDFFKEKGLRVISSIQKAAGLDLSLIPKFVKLIETEQFDIIHTHDINPLIYLGLTKLTYHLKHGESFKLIHTAHTLNHVEKSKKVEFLERVMSPMASQVVAVSIKIRNFYEKKVLLNPDKINLIENGISLEKSTHQEIIQKREKLIDEYNLNPDRPIGLCLSRILPLKDQKFLIEIFKDRADVQLLIVGPPTDNVYYQQLATIVKNSPYQNIKLLGPRTDVIELNEVSDFYVSASTHEGLPVSVLEAMSVGSPCLVSDIAGHSILNKYGKVVDTYKLGDREDFSQKLDHILKSLARNEVKMYQQGIQIVEQYFSTKKMENQYFEVYCK